MTSPAKLRPGAVSAVAANYVPASARTPIATGDKIKDLFARSMAGETVLQRIGPSSYWVHANHYNTVFRVGSSGVLLLDTPEGLYDQITAAVASVTDLPVTAVVYSHLHADHVADIGRYVQAAEDAGIQLRIIAGRQTADKMEAMKSILPRPTEILDWPHATTEVDGTTLQLYGFEWAAHTDDHSAWLLPDEGVVHSPDLIFPDQPPFWRLGGNERFLFYERNLQEIAALPWRVLSGGHGNIGYHGDITFQLSFLADLTAAVGRAFAAHDFYSFVDPELGNHTEFLTRFMAAVTATATAELRPRYGDLYGFEAATPANAEMIAFSMFAYR
jgi:glyoxylase-like metal-dependent hydrolase (beta-lactamase superfamily II)